MSTLRITSWNAQGAAISKISEVYSRILPNDKVNILLLQESGHLEKTIILDGNAKKYGNTDYIGLFAEAPQAKNLRCTTGIFADKILKMRLGIYQDLNVRRPLVYGMFTINHIEYVVATIHATANDHVSPDEIYALCQVMNSGFGHARWILMGDFNTTPEVLCERYPQLAGNIICTPGPTHQSGNRLDYAIVSNNLTGLNLKMERLNGASSDHWPVCIDINI